MKKRIKKTLLWVGLVLLALALWNGEMVLYGLGQGWGQAKILYNARPIKEVMADHNTPDSLKAKIRLVQEIRQFAVDSLGLYESENYTTLFDQKGKPVLWVVNACPPFELESYKWDYPLLGELGYKGYFVEEKAEREAESLKALGLDTDVGTVTAWSTLGWFKDPILSEMLNRSTGMIARLIIHELTHATLYVPGDGDYNENLATFVGDNGAYLFLKYKYGKNSKEYRDYEGRLSDIEKFGSHVLNGTKVLGQLYEELADEEDVQEKEARKKATIQKIVADADTVTFYDKKRYKRVLNKDFLPNNTFFMQYKMYRSEQNSFEKEFLEEFQGNFRKYIQHLKSKYPSVS